MRRSRYQHQQTSSRRRRLSEHFRFLDLPVEIRLLVIEHSLPQVNDVSRHWPAPIPALLRVSKQFNTDTWSVMKNWSPLHYVPDPKYLSSIPHPGPVKVENICLSMFHHARIGVLRSGPNTSTRSEDHQDLVQTWIDHVYDFPLFNTIRTITIDATPAPGWLRYDKPTWIPNIVNDKSVAERFIYEHITVITDLMTSIAIFYSSLDQTVQIELAGLYGQRSSTFPDFIHRRTARADLHVAFTGQVLSPPPNTRSRSMTLHRAFGELYSPHSIPTDLYPSEQASLSAERRRLQERRYSPTTDFLFANCYTDHEYWTMHQLERISGLALDDDHDDYKYHRRRHIDVPIPDFAAGSFVCSLAKDLWLTTSPRSDWRKKEIRVYRNRKRGYFTSQPARRSGFSFSDIALTGAAVLLFFAIVNHENRRARR